MTAGDLMVDLARIQQAKGEKRTALLAAARAKWAKHEWPTEAARDWARWAWQEGIR